MKNIPAPLLAHYQLSAQTTAICFTLALAVRQPRVVHITNANPGVVTCLWPHRYKFGDICKFDRIEGMTEINHVVDTNELYATITPIDPMQFSINVDTTSFSPYLLGSSYGTARKVIGFTEFESDLFWNGIRLQAKTGAQATAVEQSSDTSFSNADVEGVLSSDQIVPLDVEEGLYQEAEFEKFEVNYKDASMGRNLLQYGRLGEIKWGDLTFIAEFLGLLALLSQQQGPLTSITCRAQCGTRITDKNDERYGCGVRLNPPQWLPLTDYTAVEPFDARLGSTVKPSLYNGRHYPCTNAGTSGLTEPVWNTTIGGVTISGGAEFTTVDALTKIGTVTAVTDRRTFSDFIRTEAPKRFTHGLLTFTDGENAGFATEVRSFEPTSYGINLVQSNPVNIFRLDSLLGNVSANFNPGDQFTVANSATKDGLYTVSSVAFTSGQTRITVVEAVPAPTNTTDGDILWRPGVIALRQRTYRDIHVGDPYEVEVGDDKRLDTCIDKFDNVYNMQAEPYIPGVHKQMAFPDAAK